MPTITLELPMAEGLLFEKAIDKASADQDGSACAAPDDSTSWQALQAGGASAEALNAMEPVAEYRYRVLPTEMMLMPYLPSHASQQLLYSIGDGVSIKIVLVIPRTTSQRVGPRTTAEYVVTSIPIDFVVAKTAIDTIVTASTFEDVIRMGTDDGVIAFATENFIALS